MTTTATTAPELVLDNVTAGYFTHDIVLDGVSMRVTPGKVTAVLGPNGSGKSTSLRVMSGFLIPRQGRVTLGGEDITTLTPGERLARGVAVLPQGRSVFPQLTIDENLRLGAWQLRKDKAPGGGRRQDVDRYPTLRPIRNSRRGR